MRSVGACMHLPLLLLSKGRDYFFLFFLPFPYIPIKELAGSGVGYQQVVYLGVSYFGPEFSAKKCPGFGGERVLIPTGPLTSRLPRLPM